MHNFLKATFAMVLIPLAALQAQDEKHERSQTGELLDRLVKIQAMGEAKGIAELWRLCEEENGAWVHSLCRLLFEARENGKFRRAAIGASTFYGQVTWIGR